MALPPAVTATLQSAVIAATANILAQAITAHKKEVDCPDAASRGLCADRQNQIPLVLDWVPVFQFFIFTVVITPPNLLWCESVRGPLSDA
jgi:hypothetical protein